MSTTLTTTFPVRYHECDAYGHVNNTHYLRYMIESGLLAGREAGCDLAQAAEIAAVEIEYLRPLRYRDTVQVRASAAALGPEFVRFEFHIYDSVSQTESSRGWIEYRLGPEAAREVRGAIATHFYPGGAPDTFPPRAPFPVAPPPPPGVFKMRREVTWHEIDSTQKVGPAEFAVYAEDCGMAVIAAHHWPVERMNSVGLAILVRKQQIEYVETARLRDTFEIATWASEIKRATALRHYRFSRAADGAKVAEIHALGVWLDLATGRPIRITPELLDDFGPNLVSDPAKAPHS